MTSLEEAGLAQSLASEVTCPLCSALFSDPVRLDCEHNYCRQCILDYWKEGGGGGGGGEGEGGYTCLLCREIFPQFTLKSNKLLAKIVERVRGLGLQYRRTAPGGDAARPPPPAPAPASLPGPAEGQGPGERSAGQQGGGGGREGAGAGGGAGGCPTHSEPLKVYCLEESVAICVVCAVSKEHKTHSLAPLEEVLTQCEDNFLEALRDFEKQKERVETFQLEKEKEIQELKESAAALRAGIVSQVDALLQFLEGEKGALCSRLDSDLDRLLGLRRAAAGRAAQEVAGLLQEVTSLRGRLGQEVRHAPALIKDLQEMTQRLRAPLAVPEAAGGQLDLGLYGGPLQWAVWRRMRRVLDPAPCPLTLDPATANPFLSLTADLTAARYSHAPREPPAPPGGVPSSPPASPPAPAERFEVTPCALARQAFSRGRHYWEVDVGDRPDWDVGVAEAGAERGGWVVLAPDGGFWTVGGRACRRVGVFLDCEGGQLSFYDADRMEPLLTYAGAPFGEPLYPFFYPSADPRAEPLRLLNPRE
ncbi:E3 ubiquitin-protein ligase TRIM11-like [Lepisosteus oculatus]|uniref:E3 ubiquitin-protein ligase TRIM11-like n=1 Tax=Lepisosteus oculatus TaxID=7918 RepID=UPI0035F51E19